MSTDTKTVTLANQTRFPLVLNLPYDTVPEMSSRGVVGTRVHDPVTGTREVKAHKKRISGSVTLMPKGRTGDMVRGLPPSVLSAPDVKRALEAWPPKLAAKTLDAKAREQEVAAETVAAAKAAAAATTAAAHAKAKAATKALIARGGVPLKGKPAAPIHTEGAPAVLGEVPVQKAPGRVARSGGKE